MTTDASLVVTFGIPALALISLGLGLWAVAVARPEALCRAALGATVWVAGFGVLAGSGVLGRLDLRPPPLAVAMPLLIATGVLLGRSSLALAVAERVPLWALVLSQAFRLPLELVMHEAALEGVMPSALSFSGYNFDVLTGASALVLGLSLRRGASPRLAFAWSVFGSACLVVIAVIAIVTSPMLALLGPQQINTWVTRLPFVYLPTVMVVFAIAGHFVVFRKLGAIRAG